ncbi:hypothetical protein NUACC21_75950 [Scytonema sp. NUACC21]
MAHQEKSREELEREVLELRERLEVAEETLRAITQGEVDALVVFGAQGEQIFTLQSADYPYRRFVEDMQEGAATINSDGIILYCNNRLASWLKHSLEKIIGSELKQYVIHRDWSKFQTLFQQAQKAQTGVGKGELSLIATDGTEIPVQVSINSLTMSDVKISGLIVTDLSEPKQNERIIATQTAQLIQTNTQLQQELQERQKVEEALQASQSLFNAIIEGTTDLIAALDMDFKFIALNSSCKAEFLRIFGREIDIGTSLIEAVAHLPEEQAKLVQIWSRALAGEQFTIIEEFGDRAYERNYYEITYSNIKDKNGQQIGASLIAKNVSNRLEIEQALRDSEERLQLVLEGSGDGFWDWNIATEEVYYSPRYVEMLGYEIDEFPQNVDSWKQLIHPDDQSRVMGILEAHFQDSSCPYSFDYRLLTKSREWKWIADYGKIVVRDENGKPLRMTGTHKDISDRKLAQQQLELQAVITRNMPGGICLIRVTDWVIVYANPKFEKIFGYDAGELNGKPVSVVNYEDDQVSALETTKQIIHKIETYGEATYEVRNVKKDGTQFWCRATCSIFDHPEYGTVYVAVQHDITEQKQAEELIKNSLKEKEVLLKEIHHRVKNNLQIITSLLQMQSRRTQEPQALEVLRDSKNRIASIALVHEKLYRSEDLANIDFGQYIPGLIRHLFDTYKVSPNTITLNTNVEAILLAIDTAIPCGLIVNELVSNSFKYAFPANRQGEIYVEFLANSDNTLTLIVRDNGIGIPEEFDIKNTPSLGLTLVYGLVEQLEGIIELERNQGTQFKITFPGGKL